MTNLASVFFIGHNCDSLNMAAIGMGNVLIGMFCMAFCFGLNGTLESKVSMAYGSKDYEMCALWLNRGRMINTFLMLPIAVLFFQSGNILKSTEQVQVKEQVKLKVRVKFKNTLT